MKTGRWSRIAMILVLLVAMVVTTIALADNTVADGDGVTPVGNNDMNFGTVCAGSTTTMTAPVVVNRNGNAGSTNVFKDGSTVTVSVLSVTGSGLSAEMGSPFTITLPGDWSDKSNNYRSDSVSSSVTFVAGAVGTFTGLVTYRGAGVNSSDAAINRDDQMTVTATIEDCAPQNTPPTVSVTGVTDGESYNIGFVPLAECSVTDHEDGNKTIPATFSAISGLYALDGIGSQTASCSYTDSGGLSVGPVTVTYSIVDPSAPVIGYILTPASPDGSNSWYKSNVTLTWTVTENESPSSLQETGCVDQSITADQQETTYSCSAMSAGGSATQVDVQIKRDTTAPAASPTVSSGTLGLGGWYTSEVTVAWNWSDGSGSGIDTTNCTSSTEVTTEGVQTLSASCEDLAGNTGNASFDVKLDKTAPTAAPAVTTGTAGMNGWYISDLTVTWNWSDKAGGSGVDTTNCTSSTEVTTEGVQTLSASCKDLAGNTGNASFDVKLDKTAPVITWYNVPADFYFSFNPSVEPSCTAVDNASGLDGLCLVNGYATTVGPNELKATAKDMAGNVATEYRTYKVLAWTFGGFYQPVDMTPVGSTTVWNTVKNGSTVPLKFEVFAGPTELTSTSIVSAWSKQVMCNAGTEDTVEVVATGGTSLRYDTVAGQFVYNWQTPKLPGKCYSVTMTTQDGSSLTAYFKLK